MGNGGGGGSGPEPSTLDPCAHLDPHMEGLLVLSNQVYFSDIVCRFPEEGKKILFFFHISPRYPIHNTRLDKFTVNALLCVINSKYATHMNIFCF